MTSRRLSRSFLGALMLAYFGSNVALFAPLQNVLPRLVESAEGPAGKAAGLGLVTGLGALAALIANPVAGHFSDRRVAADNRSAAILTGLITGAAALGLLGFQRSLPGLAISWTLCQATINIAYSSMAASVFDQVPRGCWGLAWGLIAVAQAVGLIAGFATVVLVFPGATAGMLAVTVIYAACLIPLVVILYRLPHHARLRAPGQAPGQEVGAWPRADGTATDLADVAGADGARQGDDTLPAHDQGVTSGQQPGSPAGRRPGLAALASAGQGFGLVWIAKFLVMLANSVALLYLYYYLQDVVHYPRPGQGQLILVVIVTAAAILATVAIGRLADRSAGYRRYAVLATALMAATAAILAGISAWPLVIVCAFAIGIGYGAFQSASQALSMTVLPDPASAARDLGIINIAAALPAVIGPPVAAVVVTSAGGYRGLFAFAAMLALTAALVFARVPAPAPTT